ncbi:hypothetical protein GCM10010841_30130 [Deinococcus aerophilus]|uniref:Uncharacterized protein n=1 Tax=Deinococcus aerophilus TaxID=522488 RepID=A0ABQ2GYE6_9DEIO|nr:hypothetical protein GCM10010841_30130 [Deinococcus aerophilus]
MGLLHEGIAAGGGDDLDVLYGVEHGKLTQCRPIAPQLTGVNDFRHVVFPRQTHEQRLGRLGIAVFLKKDVQHAPVLVHRPPQPVLDPADLDAVPRSGRAQT